MKTLNKKSNSLFFIFLFFSIILPFSVFGMQINEIMYNPAGDDNNREYIEIYSEETLNLTGYIMSDGDSNDTLKQVKTSNSKYSLIVEDEYNFTDLSKIDVSVYFIGASIGNGLSEDDLITIYDKNKQIVDSVAINKNLANGNNKSISFYNGEWVELEPTPGYENKKQEIAINNTQNNQSSTNNTSQNNTQVTNNQTNMNQTETNSTNVINNTINTNQTNANNTNSVLNQTTNNQTFVNQTISNQTITNQTHFNNTINISITINNTSGINNSVANITNNSSDIFIINKTDNTCDISINISTDKEVYGNHEKISFYNKLNYDKISYIIEYWVEDSDGGIIKNKVQTTNQNRKSYTPKKSIDGEIKIKVLVRNLSCKDIDLTNNQFEKIILVEKDPEEENEDDETEESPAKEKKAESKTKLSYAILKFPKKVKANEPFEVEIKIENTNQENSFEISSYVYKGSKCYSAGRDDNKIEISLEKGETRNVKLENLVVEEINGNYSLKVKIRKNSQKTFKELKEQIEVEKNRETEEEEEGTSGETMQKKQAEGLLSSKNNINKENPLEKITELRDNIDENDKTEKSILYESSSEKLKKNINYLILFVSATVSIAAVWKYERKGNKGKG